MLKKRDFATSSYSIMTEAFKERVWNRDRSIIFETTGLHTGEYIMDISKLAMLMRYSQSFPSPATSKLIKDKPY
jgi:hypothetical protein